MTNFLHFVVGGMFSAKGRIARASEYCFVFSSQIAEYDGARIRTNSSYFKLVSFTKLRYHMDGTAV